MSTYLKCNFLIIIKKHVTTELTLPTVARGQLEIIEIHLIYSQYLLMLKPFKAGIGSYN